jgi:DNA polymerase-4
MSAVSSSAQPDCVTESPPLLDWLFFDLNSYFASVEQQLQPRLRGRPVAVVPVITDYTCAIAASYEAKKFGIKTGTMIRDARQRCPEIVLVPARHEKYVEYHHKVMEEVDRHIPIEKICSIDEMACRLTGKWRQQEHAIALSHRMKAGLKKNVGECITCSIGLSTNRFLAKVATDLQKPDGLVILHPRDLPGSLAHLIPRDLPGIGAGMEARLQKAGIHTFEDLWALAPKQMRLLWHGVGGERFWYALRGVEIAEEASKRGSVGHSHVLEPAQRPPHLAEAVGRRLLLKAASRMRKDHYFARAMSVSVRLEKGVAYQVEQRFGPLRDSTAFQRMFTGCWAEIIASSGKARIKKVSVTLHGLVHEDIAGQPDLFEFAAKAAKQPRAEEKERRERLSAAIDEITRRYGRDAVTTGIVPGAGSSFTGTKIAFNRVPELEDFDELGKESGRKK